MNKHPLKSIPLDMQDDKAKKELEEQGIKCSSVVSIRDLLIHLNKKTLERHDEI